METELVWWPDNLISCRCSVNELLRMDKNLVEDKIMVAFTER